VETRSRGPRRELLEEVKATRGSTIDHRLTPVRCARTFRMHQSLESAYERSIHRRFRAAARSRVQRQEGQSAPNQ
jgi:hypothetical protein